MTMPCIRLCGCLGHLIVIKVPFRYLLWAMCDDVQLCNRCVREFLILAQTWFAFSLPSKTGCDTRHRPNKIARPLGRKGRLIWQGAIYLQLPRGRQKGTSSKYLFLLLFWAMCDDVQLCNHCVRKFLILARIWFAFGLPSKTGCDTNPGASHMFTK